VNYLDTFSGLLLLSFSPIFGVSRGEPSRYFDANITLNFLSIFFKGVSR
jgi:hypothetical protein